MEWMKERVEVQDQIFLVGKGQEDVVGKVVSGDVAGLGNQLESTNRPSKG